MATEWNGYFYIEDLGLTPAQRQTLVDVLKAWGLRNLSIHPQERNHWRVRPDAKAVIFEAFFDADNMTVAWFKQKLADIFSVPVGSITSSTTQTPYGPLITFKYNSVDRLRMGVYGGLSATWLQSWQAAAQYLTDYKSQWNVGLP